MYSTNTNYNPTLYLRIVRFFKILFNTRILPQFSFDYTADDDMKEKTKFKGIYIL